MNPCGQARPAVFGASTFCFDPQLVPRSGGQVRRLVALAWRDGPRPGDRDQVSSAGCHLEGSTPAASGPASRPLPLSPCPPPYLAWH
eukprot:11531182-Alexandrium_andersonii.AAC.1